jgi:PAS domain S-box-containing protein
LALSIALQWATRITVPLSDKIHDRARLAALAGYHILDTEPEKGFDDLVRLATRLCHAPTALVSLVADNRQWFKARIGFPDCETDLNSSVCAYVLTEPDLLVIPDLAADARTASNPLVMGEPHIRFYAGAPLRSDDGHVLGSLCVIDTVVRPEGLTPEQAEDLKALADQVMIQLSMRRAAAQRDELLQQQSAILAELSRTEEELRLAVDATQIGVFDLNLVTGELRWDARVRELFGVAYDVPVSYETFLHGLHPDDRVLADAAVQTALDPDGPGIFDTEYRAVSPDGVERWLGARGKALLLDGKAVRFIGTVRDITSRRRAETSLQETEERFRLAVRATNDAIWDWDLVTNHVLWNEALTTAHGHKSENVEPTGDWWIAHIHPDDRERIDLSIHAVIDGTDDVWVDNYRFRRADGTYADILDRGYVIRDATQKAIRMIGAMLDNTEQTASERRKQALVALGDGLRDLTKAHEMVRVASEIVGHTLQVERAGFGELDTDIETIDVIGDWTAPGFASLAGQHVLADYGDLRHELLAGGPVVIDNIDIDTRTVSNPAALRAVGPVASVNIVVRDRGKTVAIMFAHSSKPRQWPPEAVSFVRNVADRLQAGIARLRAEREQRVLNEELSHRMKNTMAMIQTIASQTLRDIPDQVPVEAFNKRLFALSSAHDVLLKQSWAAAPVIEVIRSVLGTFGMTDRFVISGPNIEFGARATLSLSLLLHELATNATKYGALSGEQGEVHVAWLTRQTDGIDDLVLAWHERGGPSPQEPDQTGFGSRLIRMGLIGTGQVKLRYKQSGFEAEFIAPLNQVRS